MNEMIVLGGGDRKGAANLLLTECWNNLGDIGEMCLPFFLLLFSMFRGAIKYFHRETSEEHFIESIRNKFCIYVKCGICTQVFWETQCATSNGFGFR